MEHLGLTTKSLQTQDSPIIVGEHYELVEAVALDYTSQLPSSLLAKPGHTGAIFPMSDYGQQSGIDVSGLSAARLAEGSTALADYNVLHVLPGGADAQYELSAKLYDQHADQGSLDTSLSGNHTTTYEITGSHYTDFISHKGSDVPAMSFQYGNNESQTAQCLTTPSVIEATPEVTRKRKLVLDFPDQSNAVKRISPTYPPVTDERDGSSYSYRDSRSPYSQELRSTNASSLQRNLTPYGRTPERQVDPDDTMKSSFHNFLNGAVGSQSLMKPRLTQTPSHSSSYATHQSTHSPGMSSTASFPVSSSSSPNPANPPLVRASTMQHSTGSKSNSTAPSSDSAFNSYGMYSNRAFIQICGDLKTMQVNWTPEERSAKRRLVRFRGEQKGSTIKTYFEAVKPEERPSASGVREKRVSCIYWEEKDEYYVTSVDTIALLETLVGARFGVEEKNRIRRNLETHRPSTISKAKLDTESFFKVIMGFPNPKPRNIEKDVKVFQWPELALALQKVIGKYSPSPASIAGPPSASRISTMSGASPDTGSDRYARPSSRLSTGSIAYASALRPSLLSPMQTSNDLVAPYPQTSPMAAPSPSLAQSYTIPTPASQFSQNDRRLLPDTGYAEQKLPSNLSQTHSNTNINRRRSSDASIRALNGSHYRSRPRANTSFPTVDHSTTPIQYYSDYSFTQLPSSVQPSRPSWDYSWLRNEPGSFGQEYPLRSLSRQNSNALQIAQQGSRPDTSQSALG